MKRVANLIGKQRKRDKILFFVVLFAPYQFTPSNLGATLQFKRMKIN